MSQNSPMTPGQLRQLPPDYLAENRGRPLFNVSVAFIVLETIFFSMFVASRIILKNCRGIETWCFMPLGYLSGVAGCIISILMYKHQAGRHVAYFLLTDPETITWELRFAAASEYLYGGGITFPKLAIVALYLRVLREKWARRVTWLVGITIVLHELSMILGASLICRPFAYKWNKTIPNGHCGNYMAIYRFISLPNIITDIVIILTPLLTLYRLQIPTSRKLGILLTFVVGGCGIITAIIRFVHFYTIDLFSDFTYYGADTQTWTVVEPGAYFLCACLPGIRPIIRVIANSTAYCRLVIWLENHARISRRSSSPQSDEIHLPDSPSTREWSQVAPKVSSATSDGGGSLWLEKPQFEYDPSLLEAATRFPISP